MAERNFFGRLRDTAVNRIAPGNVVDERGNYLHNGGRAAVATALKFGANMFFPGAGMLVDKIAAPWVNRGASYGIGDPQREGIPIYGAPSTTQRPAFASTPSVAPNLGLGAQTPGNSWQGYMQGAGSANNFGNQQFGSGMASIPGTWAPSSGWGQSVTGGQPSPGSLGGFGNNVPNFLSGNSGAATTASRTGGSSGPVSSLGMGVRGALLGPRSSLGIEKGRVKV